MNEKLHEKLADDPHDEAVIAAFRAELADLPDTTTDRPAPAPASARRPAAGVPALAGVQAEGDLLVVPTRGSVPHWAQRLLHDRPVTVVGDGNGHVLRAVLDRGGRVVWAPIDGHRHVIARVEVTEGAVLLLEQPGGGHDALAIGPGRYDIRRQRERVQQVRAARSGWVAD